MKTLRIGDLIIRPAKAGDLKAYVRIQKVEWKKLAVAEEQAKARFKINLPGIIIAEHRGRVVGSITTIRISGYDHSKPKTWYQVTGDGSGSTHTPNGKICFGVDLSVDTDKAPSGTVDGLFVGCMNMVIDSGVKYFMLGGRMPKYHLFADKMTAGEYLYKKTNKHYLDPQVDLYSRVPLMKIMGLAPNYFKDPQSLDNGVILRWRNPVYGLPLKGFWSAAACQIFTVFLNRQRRAYHKRLEKMPL